MSIVASASTRLTRRVTLTSTLLCVVFLSGCTSIREYVANGFKVGPNYHQPNAMVANEWIDSYDPKIVSAPADLTTWWTIFNDPVIDRIVEVAAQQNLSLRVAGLRVLEARARRGIAAGNLFPQSQQAFATYSRQQISKTTALAPPIAPRAFDMYSTGFDAAWELDIWGRFRRAIESADANVDASMDNYGDVMVTLIGDAVATYVDMRTFETRIAFAMRNVEIQEGIFTYTSAQLREGTGEELDVQQARANLEQTRALIPLFEAGRRQAQNRLCILMGIPPRQLDDLVTPYERDAYLELTSIPPVPPDVVIGIPGDLLRRRPDIRRAEREVASQSARIGIATSDLYPQLNLVGNIFVEAEDFSDLFTSASTAGGIGPSIRWNILNYGRIANNIVAQDARFQQLAVIYQDTVLRANQEAEDAIVGFLQAQQRVQNLEQSTAAAARSVELVDIKFKEGAVDLNRVFVLQEFLVRQQDLLTEAKGEVVINLIRLYKALGGGWHAPCMCSQNPGPVRDQLELLPPAIPSDSPPAPSSDSS